MGEVNFYLKTLDKDAIKAGAKTPIYLQFKYKGIRLKYYLGESISPNHWNKAKQRVKSNATATKDGQHSLNDLMDNLEKILLTTYRAELAKSGIPPKARLKQALDGFIYQHHEDPDRPTLYKLIDRFISGEIQNKGKKKTYGTLQKYVTVKNHLQKFESKAKYKIDFDTITLDFFNKYVTYLQKENLAQNTIAKNIDILKVFMKRAVKLKYTNNTDFESDDFDVSWEESDSVYLTEKEVEKLYKHNFEDNPRLDQVRDLFVFGCHVGLRFSDYSDIKPENITTVDEDKFIRMRTKKTGEVVVIPCSPIVLQIFEKYKDSPNNLPRALSNQKFNQYIKEVANAAKLNETGRLISEPKKELWECISSHTARRSFATNLYLQSFPSLEIMKITGHRTEKAFLNYIKVSKLDAAKRLSLHMKKQWDSKILKAV